ncbi:hypothetical protein M758_11G015600 [Ceratodon purpureus]|nr:hypothetical protein M758_11G015600 [Ceratodon purpureus]
MRVFTVVVGLVRRMRRTRVSHPALLLLTRHLKLQDICRLDSPRNFIPYIYWRTSATLVVSNVCFKREIVHGTARASQVCRMVIFRVHHLKLKI